MNNIKDKLGKRQEVRLEEVATILSGGTPSTGEESYWENGDIEWFTPSEVGKSKYVTESKRKITKKGLEKSSAKIIPKHSILLSTRATVGESSINNVECTTNQGFQSLVPNNDLELDYLYYFIKFLKPLLIRLSTGSTFLEISSSEVKKLNINIHKHQYQEKISGFLSSIDILIDKQEEYISQLEVIMQVILRQVFNVENEKQMIKLLNVGNIVTGKTPSTKNKELWNGTIPFITPTDMKNTKYTLTERYVSNDFLNASYILPKESVCFTSIASIGKMCKTQEASITNQQINSIICNESYNSDYVYYNLRYLVSKIKSMVISDGMAMINKTEFGTIKIKNVILDEQNKIADLLSSMDKLIELNKDKLEQLKLKKKYYLNEIFG